MFRYYLKLGALSIRGNPCAECADGAAIGIGIGACMTIMMNHQVMSGNPIPHKCTCCTTCSIDNWNPDEP